MDIRFEEYSFVDFGSGKGRALLLASHKPFRKIVGIELAQPLHEIALHNIKKYSDKRQQCSNIASINIDATQFLIPDEKMVFFFFNPFNDEILNAILSNIKKSLERLPRQIFILYANPKYRKAFDEKRFITLIAEEKGVDAYSNFCVYASDPTPI